MAEAPAPKRIKVQHESLDSWKQQPYTLLGDLSYYKPFSASQARHLMRANTDTYEHTMAKIRKSIMIACLNGENKTSVVIIEAEYNPPFHLRRNGVSQSYGLEKDRLDLNPLHYVIGTIGIQHIGAKPTLRDIILQLEYDGYEVEFVLPNGDDVPCLNVTWVNPKV